MSADRIRTLASRTFHLWRVVKLFREVSHRGIPATVEHVRTQTTRILGSLDPMTRTLSEMNQPGYAEAMLAETVESASSAAQAVIEKTSIVLAHSILDEVVSECCRISAELLPARWAELVQHRKVTLAVALRSPAAEIQQRLLAEFLDQLNRESLRKRVDLLNERYQPATPFTFDGQTYRFDRQRLEAVDSHRQRIIHRVQLTREPQDQEEDDLRYLEATCFFFIEMLGKAHAVPIEPASDAIESLRAKATSAVRLTYEGLLLATSLPRLEEKVWSAGGQVFASANQKWRQLPLLMPAATPDLSPDHKQLIFVKYRRKIPLPIEEGEREYISDIWMSGANGDDAGLILEGGPRSDLVPPIEGLPAELEGIESPKFDPDMERVYFIADAWATSGAIYVLDLRTREVRFLTPGNVFAVLHGEPYRGSLIVCQHRYYDPPTVGSYDDFWLVSADGEVGRNLGSDFDEALEILYGANGREKAFPHFRGIHDR